ncbi:MAG: hypothetical protein LZF60_80002 [Nitrospira sp.]|nr:MAG: hypothetical protein LZF60_80002 [Nitrospira sp.]
MPLDGSLIRRDGTPLPLILLSIGSVSVTVSILLAGDAIMGLSSNEHQPRLRQRKALSETKMQFKLAGFNAPRRRLG